MVISKVKHERRERRIHFELISLNEEHLEYVSLGMAYTESRSPPAFSDG